MEILLLFLSPKFLLPKNFRSHIIPKEYFGSILGIFWEYFGSASAWKARMSPFKTSNYSYSRFTWTVSLTLSLFLTLTLFLSFSLIHSSSFTHFIHSKNGLQNRIRKGSRTESEQVLEQIQNKSASCSCSSVMEKEELL